LRKCPVSLDKGFLHNIFRLSLIADKPRHQPHQLSLVLGYEQLERLFIAALDTFDKELVNIAFCRQSRSLVSLQHTRARVVDFKKYK
jgi:hypothetical protein